MTPTPPLRALVLTSLYPPHAVGGYELGCLDAVEGLRRRGWTVDVLTTRCPETCRHDEPGVIRTLWPAPAGGAASPAKRVAPLVRWELANRAAVSRTMRRRRPDIVFVWQLHPLSTSLALLAARRGVPVAYYVFDHWLARWRDDPWHAFWLWTPGRGLARLALRAVRPVMRAVRLLPKCGPDPRYAQFASRFLQQREADERGGEVAGTVIPFGVAPEAFRPAAAPDPSRLLVVGRLVPEKGVETAVEAFAQLDGDATLTIAGGGRADYVAGLRRLAADRGVAERVAFRGQLERGDVLALYGEHGVLIFPSVWEEPFGMVLLEAMASGLAVVATGTGGSAEILEDGRNCLLFPPGDAAACAARVRELVGSPAFFAAVRAGGLATVAERFRLEDAIAAIDRNLRAAISERKGA